MAPTLVTLLALLVTAYQTLAGGDRPTKFTNIDSIANTRHNMTQSTMAGPYAVFMDNQRNDYGEVCVYCHTPHGAGNVGLPLWNRTIKATTYTTYNQLNSTTLTQPVTQPGTASLSCLSCHDGQTAIDSIINMPGSGRYSASQATSVDNDFLNTWTNPSGFSPTDSHGTLAGQDMGGPSAGCMACHAPGFFPAATNFQVFVIGTDLTNDHPVGITFPTGNPDFNAPAATQAGAKFFDLNGNGRMDKNEVRVYDTGDGHEVECASCHDPHGVPSGAAGSTFIPTFMRVANGSGSGLCLTCHVK